MLKSKASEHNCMVSLTYHSLCTDWGASLGSPATELCGCPGKLHADDYQFLSPRVQFGQDTAVLTFQVFAHTNINDIEYNCVEVFQKESGGQWHVIHSTWSTIRPMDKDFSRMKVKV